MTRVPLLWILALVLVLGVPALASTPSVPERGEDYREAFRALAGPVGSLQNSDGGFGPVGAAGNATGNVTLAGASSFQQTVFTVHLLRAEDTDIYATRTNWEGHVTSLAASNVSNAHAWLRGHEAASGDSLTVGQLSLVSTAYSALGDPGNARRVLQSIALDTDALGPTEAAQVLFSHALVRPETNASTNATFAGLEEHVNATEFASTEGLAWGLLAQPYRVDRRAALAEILTHEHGLDQETFALATWALAVSGGPDDATEKSLVALWGASPVGLARTWYLLAERTAHPEFSPHAIPPPVPKASETIGIASRALLDGSGPSAGQSTAPLESTAQDRGFPVPFWVMSAIILGALAVVVVTGLAYGLRREDLNGPRRDIFQYIENHPGEHFSKIRRDVGMAPGTFQHHLSVLESDGWVTSFKDARYKRYFVNGNRYQKIIAGYTYKQKFAALANTTTRDLVRFVHQHPGVTQKQVAARLQIHASTVNWHVKRLKQAGILRDERVGKEVHYTVDGDIVDKMLVKPDKEAPLIAA